MAIKDHFGITFNSGETYSEAAVPWIKKVILMGRERIKPGGKEMGIDRASCDCWITGKDNGKEIENPTWEDIEKMILNLDGYIRTLVIFGNYDEGYYMAIGGGKYGKYIAYASYDDGEKIYNLVSQAGSEKEWAE